MPERYGGKLIAVVAGGLAILGVFIWLTIRFWSAYSHVGGAGNLIGGIVFSLFIAAWLALAVKMTM